MSTCRILCDDYEKKGSLLHLRLPRFRNFAVNDIVYSGCLDDNSPVTDYSILIYFTEEGKLQTFKNRYVDYLDGRVFNDNISALIDAVNKRYDDFYNNIDSIESVIVFDLDDTLICDDGRSTVKNLRETLIQFKRQFKRLVLWSHGTSTHVNYHIHYHKISDLFDLIMSRRNSNMTDHNKGMGAVLRELNRKFSTTKISFSCLVDDQSFNFDKDYTFFAKIDQNSKDNTDRFRDVLLKVSKRIDKMYNHNVKFDEKYRIL